MTFLTLMIVFASFAFVFAFVSSFWCYYDFMYRSIIAIALLCFGLSMLFSYFDEQDKAIQNRTNETLREMKIWAQGYKANASHNLENKETPK